MFLGVKTPSEAAPDALAAVHRAGILHRDVKAQNVMRASDGRIVLMDFGTGVDLGDDAGVLAGTPLYLAPEVMAGGDSTRPSDVYSLGVLLFHLVTGTFPVRGSTSAKSGGPTGEASARGSDRRGVGCPDPLPPSSIARSQRIPVGGTSRPRLTAREPDREDPLIVPLEHLTHEQGVAVRRPLLDIEPGNIPDAHVTRPPPRTDSRIPPETGTSAPGRRAWQTRPRRAGRRAARSR